MKTKFLTKSALLKERGWTNSLIKAFLRSPDQMKPNPRYKCAAPMLLYKESRIKRIEGTQKFKKKLEKVLSKKIAAQKAVETKLNKLISYLDSVEINLITLSKEDLIDQACKHYNQLQNIRAYQGLKYSDIDATKNSDLSFLKRICVNFLRHELTSYEDHLEEMSGKVGFDHGYFAVRDKIFNKIKEIYPWLKEECEKQNGESNAN